MGKCKYCNQDAGLFSSHHKECKERFEEGVVKIKQILNNCFIMNKDFYIEKALINSIIQKSNINNSFLSQIYCDTFDNAIDNYLNDGVINSIERATAARFIQFSGVPQEILNKNKSVEKIVQSQIIQEVLEGKIPTPRQTIIGEFPFMLSKNETVVWLFRNIILHEQKVKKEYIGRSQGMSFRIAKGVYYRVGGFKGKPIESTTMEKIACGNLCLTNKNIYFSSSQKSFKLPYNKIINLETFSNGIGVQKDGVSSKHFFLENANGWFCYNIISNLRTN